MDFRFRHLQHYRTGGARDRMELYVPFPKTPDGKGNQRCPDPECRPGLFQLGGAPENRPSGVSERMRRTPGPGDTVCPYCGRMARDQEFIDPADIEAVKQEIAWAFGRDVGDALKDMARDFNRRTASGGFISVRMDVKEKHHPRPQAGREDLLRDLECQLCGRRYGVYAIGLFCPDCGGPNLAIHFARELDLVRQQTELAEQRRAEGKRELAYRLLGNAHEDVVTAFETYQKAVFRFLVASRSGQDEERWKRFSGNWFQNIDRARKAFVELGFDPFAELAEQDVAFLKLNIEKRHVVGHNLSVADDTYAEATQHERPGRTVELLSEEILKFLGICGRVIERLDRELPVSPAT